MNEFKPKFKVGDRVVNVDEDSLYVGEYGKQQELYRRHTIVLVPDAYEDYYVTDDDTIGYEERELVLERVFDSRLYRALNDEQ